ncbi:MAG: DUF2752 domain-containing protein [Planctomycetota bacterium]
MRIPGRAPDVAPPGGDSGRAARAVSSRWTWIASISAALILLASRLFTVATLPAIDLCLFRRLGGLPCPGCGLTRAFCSISHGELQQAWSLNPFGYLFYAIALGVLLAPLWRRLLSMDVPLPRGRALTAGVVALLAAMWIFDLLRITAG